MTKQSIKVVIECENLANQSGTGIATYAANLASELHSLGYATEGLVGVGGKPEPGNNALNEVLLYDAPPPNQKPLKKYLRLVGPWLSGSPLGVKAVAVDPGAHSLSAVWFVPSGQGH